MHGGNYTAELFHSQPAKASKMMYIKMQAVKLGKTFMGSWACKALQGVPVAWAKLHMIPIIAQSVSWRAVGCQKPASRPSMHSTGGICTYQADAIKRVSRP